MRDKGSFHYPETRFISLGSASGNKPGLGVMETAFIPHNHILTVLILYRYNIFMSVHLLSFFMTVWISNVTLLCQDYAMVRRLTLNNFCRNLVKTLSIMASRRNKYSLHDYAYWYFVLITDNDVHTSCCVKWLIVLNFPSSAFTFGRKHCACATAYLMCLRCFIHTNCTSVGKPHPSFA